MLRVLKSSGRVTSSAADKPTTNSKGRVELSLSQGTDGEGQLTFSEHGNYGKQRWSTTVRVTRREVEDLVRSAQEWLAGTVQTTLPEYAEQTEPRERDVEVTPEEKRTFELVNGGNR